MKKKILTIIMVLMMALAGNQVCAFANDGIMPCFNAVDVVETGIGLDGNTVRYNVTTYVASINKVDTVHIDAELLRGGSVTMISYDKNITSTNGVFIFSGYKRVTITGTYFLEYTLTCYKDGKVVDVIDGCTNTVGYTA